jgi:hypothetical protein
MFCLSTGVETLGFAEGEQQVTAKNEERNALRDPGDPRGPESCSEGFLHENVILLRNLTTGSGRAAGKKQSPGFFHDLYQSSPRVPLQEVQ